jgi:hypothetical protein
LQLSATSQETRDRLDAEGLSPTYSVTPDRKNPILILQTSSPDPAVAQGTLDRLIQLISEDLDARQADAGAPEDTKIRAEILARDQAPERATGARARVQLLALALGLAIAAAGTVAVDHLLHRRAERASATGDSPTEEDLDGEGARAPLGATGRPEVSAEEVSERLVALFKPPKQGFGAWSGAPSSDESVDAR